MGFGNLPKVTQVISNLDSNPDPPHSMAHALSTRTKAQEQKIMEGASGSQERQEGGEGSPGAGASPHGKEMTGEVLKATPVFHTVTGWLLNTLLRGDLRRWFTVLHV